MVNNKTVYLSETEKQILDKMAKTLPLLTDNQKANLLNGVTFAAMIIGGNKLKGSV